MMKIPCSVPILTLNCREKLEGTLPILAQTFDDVFLVDGNSTDGTREYAQSLNVRVEKQFDTDEPNQRITDFPKVRMQSWEKSKHDWLLVLDADEVLTPECTNMIRKVVEEDRKNQVHWVRRHPMVNGVVVKNSPFYVAHYLRLFARSSGVSIADKLVHERFLVPEGMEHVYHDAAILCPEPSPEAIDRRTKHYLVLEAKGMQKGGLKQLLYWIIWYNIRSFFGQLMRVVVSDVRGRINDHPVLPWRYNWVFLKYRMRVMVALSREWFKRRCSELDYGKSGKSSKHLFLLGVLLAIVSIEGVLQVFDLQSYHQFTNDQKTGLLLYTPHTSFIASASCYVNRAIVNNVGLVGPDMPDIENSTGKRRIVVVGSSFVEGAQVSQADHFSHLLQEKIREGSNNKDIRVMPFGFNGNNTYLDLLYFVSYAKQYHAGDVILITTDYDIIGLGPLAMHPPRFEANGEPLMTLPAAQVDPRIVLAKNIARKSKLFMNLYGKFRIMKIAVEKEMAFALDHHSTRNGVDDSELQRLVVTIDDEEIWRSEERLLIAFKKAVEESGGRFIVASWTNKTINPHVTEVVRSRLGEISQRQGIAYIDLEPSVFARSEKAGKSPTWSCDGHWNTYGHQWVADALYDALSHSTSVQANIHS